ncbi:hypothetical protein GCM10023155_45770 [Bremerella cremea]
MSHPNDTATMARFDDWWALKRGLLLHTVYGGISMGFALLIALAISTPSLFLQPPELLMSLGMMLTIGAAIGLFTGLVSSLIAVVLSRSFSTNPSVFVAAITIVLSMLLMSAATIAIVLILQVDFPSEPDKWILWLYAAGLTIGSGTASWFHLASIWRQSQANP